MRQFVDTLVWLAMIGVVVAVVYFYAATGELYRSPAGNDHRGGKIDIDEILPTTRIMTPPGRRFRGKREPNRSLARVVSCELLPYP